MFVRVLCWFSLLSSLLPLGARPRFQWPWYGDRGQSIANMGGNGGVGVVVHRVGPDRNLHDPGYDAGMLESIKNVFVKNVQVEGNETGTTSQ